MGAGGDLAGVREAIRDLARERDAANAKWTDLTIAGFGAKIAPHLREL